MQNASQVIAQLQADGHAVAVQARYQGEFGFYGRLQQPLIQLAPGTAAAWAVAHPDDYLVLAGRDLPTQRPEMIFTQAYRSRELAIIRGRALIPYNGRHE